jgi:signal transduction histidine kinase
VITQESAEERELWANATTAMQLHLRLALHLTGMPASLIQLRDSGGPAGPPTFFAAAAPSIPVDWAPSAQVIDSGEPLVCADLLADPRFADAAVRAGTIPIRGFAGLPLKSEDGTLHGVLAVIDTVPHALSVHELDGLALAADAVRLQLESCNAQRAMIIARRRELELERRVGCERMEEAQRLAAELHDGVGQDLVGISMIVSALLHSPACKEAAFLPDIENLVRLLAAAIENCRIVAEGYGGFMIRKEGVTGALHRYVKGLHNDRINFEFTGDTIPVSCLDEAEAYYLFGIAREAIANACRHSHCSSIRVICEHRVGIMRLTVEDDGCGDTAAAKPGDPSSAGIGRAIMDHRARRIGADLSFTNSERGGVRVTCQLPCGIHRWGHATSCPATRS